jgi:hypothetical protein
MSFKKNKYQIIKKVISKDVANIAFNYLKLREAAEKKLNGYGITTKWFGIFNDPQVPNSYSIYGDYLMEALLVDTLPIIEKRTLLKLVPTYAYTRLYKTGNVLNKHTDRESCEVSATLNLGGDLWSIFITNSRGKEIEVKLNPGDLLIYAGIQLEHWREPFEGKECGQVFFHYNNKNGPYKTSNLYDKRTMLGLPQQYKGIKL